MVERIHGMDEVRGSSPLASTGTAGPDHSGPALFLHPVPHTASTRGGHRHGPPQLGAILNRRADRMIGRVRAPRFLGFGMLGGMGVGLKLA